MPTQESDAVHVPAVGEGGAPEAVHTPDDFGITEVTETPVGTPQPPPAAAPPLGMKDMLRIVVFGGGERLGGHIAFSKAFTVKPVGQAIFPETDFEAGICAAAADILVFDLTGVEFGDMLELLSTVESYVPRAVVVALLEPGADAGSLPQCGIHLAVPEPVTPVGVAKQIELLMFGTQHDSEGQH